MIPDERDAYERVASQDFVSRETLDRFEQFLSELIRWNRRINLVSRKDEDRLWSRHLLDSLGLVSMLPGSGEWMDLGSGGGFPALPLAIVSRETSPDVRFRLIESDQRKAVFLREMARRLDLPVKVESIRIEAVQGPAPRIISARALAEVQKLLSWSENWLSAGVKMVLLKGESLDDELTEASGEWHMRYQAERHPLTLKGYMLIIREAKRATLS